TLTRIVVISSAVLGTAVVATSQPGSGQQSFLWPVHNSMPNRISMNRVQEFKDGATLHLKDAQKALTNDGLRPIKGKTFISKTVMVDFFVEHFVVIPNSAIAGGTSGGQAKSITPAELAAMIYAFDQGVDMMAKMGTVSSSKMSVDQSGISGQMSPKDMGMTGPQFKQMVGQYIENHPMKFWNEARVGLAGR
ncbi:MAG: hypothetical protein WCG75_04750, partial [Armatimonadota bacterium]